MVPADSKKSIKRSLALAGMFLVGGISGVGCMADAADEGIDDVATNQMSFEEFEASVYMEPDSGVYIVNGDTPVDDIKKLREFWEQYVQGGALIVHRSGGVDAKWSDAQKVNITYCVSTTFGNNYNTAVAAMANSAAAWEQAANVNFVHLSQYDSSCTASQSNVVFDVRPVNSGGQYLARAFFPDQSRSTRNVLIDNTAFGNVSPWTLTGIMRHELGHTLGFRHEHTRPESGTCFEDNNWRALTTYDSASVMHYPQCNGSQSGDLVLTSKDIQGAQALYGAPGGGNPDPDPDPGGGTPQSQTFSGSVAASEFKQIGSFDVTPGTTFSAAMTGSGDPDLYVRWDAAPTTSAYSCRPYLGGATESCNLTVPSGTTKAYVGVRGYSSGTYNINVGWTPPAGGGGNVVNTTVSGSVAQNQNVNYGGYAVVAGTTFKVVMSGSGDPDLYVRWGAAPTTSTYHCRPYLTGASETCELTVPSGQSQAYVMVRGYTSGSYTLNMTYTTP